MTLGWAVVIFLAGAFVGWNVPQPMWAAAAQRWVRNKLRG